MLRTILLILLQYFNHIVLIDPNVGQEIGKKKGDKINATGNKHNHQKPRIFHATLLLSIMLYSLYCNFDTELTYLDYISVCIATLGTCMCFWTYYTLGEFYTFTIGIREGHRLIQHGPYTYIMHPGYLGQLMLAFGTILFCNVNIIITLILLTCLTFLTHYRIMNEEKMLEQHFGEEFYKFRSTRNHMIPYIF